MNCQDTSQSLRNPENLQSEKEKERASERPWEREKVTQIIPPTNNQDNATAKCFLFIVPHTPTTLLLGPP